MSELEPITNELRELMGGVEPRVDEDGVVTAKYVTPEAWGEFVRRCDAIDAVHAQLERENADLRQRVAELDNERGNMHDCWRITDELRAWWVRKFPVMDKELHKDFTAIADRIDAEHERGMADAELSAAPTEAQLFELGWIRLPKDADGEVIHVGERVQLIGNDPSTVSHMSLADDGWRVYVKYDGGIGTGSGEPKRIHHHAPTVEDVLREMHAELDEVIALYVGEAIDSDERDRDEARIFAEYAKRLTLAGDAS